MMKIEELETEIGMAVELKEYYFKIREKSSFNDLLFQFWCGYEIGLCIASGKLKPSLIDSYYSIPYHEYYDRCRNYFGKIARHEEMLELCAKGLIP